MHMRHAHEGAHISQLRDDGGGGEGGEGGGGGGGEGRGLIAGAPARRAAKMEAEVEAADAEVAAVWRRRDVCQPVIDET